MYSPYQVNKHPNVIKLISALQDARFSLKTWSERLAASPNTFTQASPIQDRDGPDMSKLIKYVTSVDQIIYSNLPKAIKATIAKNTPEYWFSTSTIRDRKGLIINSYHV